MPTVTNGTGRGLYSLVGNNSFTSVSSRNGVVRVTPSVGDYIPFQPGDVHGFFIESDRNNAFALRRFVVLRTSLGYSSEVVWYTRALPQRVRRGPFISAGEDGDLNTLVRGAPVVSIATGEH